MTEYERIVESGRIPKDFCKPEYRNEFLVDEKRKKIWAVELDLYLEFARVCKEYNLSHFFIFGSLLGCIRHEGFIPWDDDMDIVMPRKDYDKFITLVEEFKTPYFLQLPSTDCESAFTTARLRNSNTTAINYPFRYQQMNHGICIDILPLDNVDSGDVALSYNKVRELSLKNSGYMRLKNPKPDQHDKERIRNWKGENPQEIFDKIQDICRQYVDTQQDKEGIIAFTIYSCERQVYMAKDFEKVIWKKYEGIDVPVPQGYDNILKTIYNNYNEYPPLEKRIGHETCFFDPDCSYLKYLKEKCNI